MHKAGRFKKALCSFLRDEVYL